MENRKIIRIDPTNPNLPLEHQNLLGMMFMNEEKKHGQKDIVKQKIWKKGEIYPVTDNESICFSHHEISRSPNRLDAVVTLGPDDQIPNLDERLKVERETGIRALYIKKNSDTDIQVCTSFQLEPRKLTEEQIRELSKNLVLTEFKSWLRIPDCLPENDEEERTQKIKERRKFISSIQDMCGYREESPYIYTVTQVTDKNNTDMIGSSGSVELVSGELKITKKNENYQMTYVKSSEDEILKIIPLHGKEAYFRVFAKNEATILKENSGLMKRLHTWDATIQKDEKTELEEIRFRQRKVPGKDLFTLSRKLNLEQRIKLFRLLLEALAIDQDDGIVHRDIKAENVIVDIDEETGEIRGVNIIDYGFSRRASAPSDERFCGTAPYFSPELAGERISDWKSDDYSMGILLRELFDDDVVAELNKMSVFEGNPPKDRVPPYYPQLIKRFHDQSDISKPQCRVFRHLSQRSASPEITALIELINDILIGLTKTDRDQRMSCREALEMVKSLEKKVSETPSSLEQKTSSGMTIRVNFASKASSTAHIMNQMPPVCLPVASKKQEVEEPHNTSPVLQKMVPVPKLPEMPCVQKSARLSMPGF